MYRQMIELHSRGRGFQEITAAVRRAVAASGVRDGLCHLFLQHTSASLCITENAAPAVRDDLQAWAAALNVPHDVKIYPEAGHAFFDDTRSSYVASAADDAWTRVLAFFKDQLGLQT